MPTSKSTAVPRLRTSFLPNRPEKSASARLPVTACVFCFCVTWAFSSTVPEEMLMSGCGTVRSSGASAAWTATCMSAVSLALS